MVAFLIIFVLMLSSFALSAWVKTLDSENKKAHLLIEILDNFKEAVGEFDREDIYTSPYFYFRVLLL